MASSQRSTRRSSARLMEKEDAPPPMTNGYHGYNISTNGKANATNNGFAVGGKQNNAKVAAAKKRKAVEYDEEVEGFHFTRTRSKRPRASTSKAVPPPEPVIEEPEPQRSKHTDRRDGESGTEQKKPKRPKMSFSTPKAVAEKQQEKPKRRSSRRISGENGDEEKSASSSQRDDEAAAATKKGKTDEPKHPSRNVTNGDSIDDVQLVNGGEQLEKHFEATKIALPFADTPVIRRNKEMRQAKGGKDERRSSLGMRGRRASSLIDSGNSNALPHSEVDVTEYYKHIESEGLSEPRRMRQLLTWCATRAIGEKPSGSRSEDESARLAARVIQEELLKDFANRSEMSDWFSREETAPPTVVIKNPNPKNLQNAAKIQELEEQIKRLQTERSSLESLLKPPSIPPLPTQTHSNPSTIEPTLLDPPQQSYLTALPSSTTSTTAFTLSTRLTHLTSSLGPTIDAFTDGVHKISQYCIAADRVAGRVLSDCAAKLEERDREGRRKGAIIAGGGNADEGEDGGGGELDIDLGGVLRGLSRIER